MFPRVGGALLALAAAALLAGSTLASPWWSGHPDIDGKTMRIKTLDVGPLGASSCNTDGKCTAVTLTSAFRTVGRIEGGASGVVSLGLVVLALVTLARSERRKGIGKAVLLGVIAIGAGGIVVLVLGPGIKADGHTLALPKAAGLALFWSGVATSIAAALVTAREIPRKFFIPKQPVMTNAMLPPQQPFDVQALLENPVGYPPPAAPAALATVEPIGYPAPYRPPAQSPGGALPGPAGPLGGPPPAMPLFASAPQLRPLYEMDGQPPYVSAPPPLPTRAPTPLPREQYDKMTEAPIIASRPRSATGLPAPNRAKPTSMPPPRPRAVADGAPPPPFSALGPPMPPRPAPPSRPAIPPRPVRPTVPPVPTFVMRAETDPGEGLETVQREKQDPEPALPMPRDVEAHRTDANPFPSDDTSPNVNLGTIEDRTIDNPTDQSETAPAPSPEDDLETRAHEKMSADDLATTAEPALSAVEPPPSPSPGPGFTPVVPMPKPAPRPPKPVLAPQPAPVPAAIAGPAAVAAAAAAALAAPPSAPAPAPAAEDPKIPISTAPQSLPPPIVKKASSGPSPACPQCESPMAWVEEHLRFYCKSCRMYF